MDRELQRLVERGVDALEKLAADPVIDVPVKPPVCPHCEKLNPKVRVSESEATGPLFEFIIQAHCLHCNQVFYGIPESWSCVRELEQASQLMAERAELANYGNDGRTN